MGFIHHLPPLDDVTHEPITHLQPLLNLLYGELPATPLLTRSSPQHRCAPQGRTARGTRAPLPPSLGP